MRPFRLIGIVFLGLATGSLAMLPAQFLQHRRKAFQAAPSSLPNASDVLAWWSFDNNNLDSSGNGYSLSDNNTPTFQTGKVGTHCKDFDVGSDWVARTNAAWLSPAGDFSVAFWVKAADMTPTLEAACISVWNSTGNQRCWMVRVKTTGEIIFYVNSDGTTGTTIPTPGATVLANNTWYFIVCVFDASTSCKVYINGVEDGTNSTSIPSAVNQSTTADLLIPNVQADPSLTLVSSLDEVAIFNTALTAGQITALYDAGNGSTFADLP